MTCQTVEETNFWWWWRDHCGWWWCGTRTKLVHGNTHKSLNSWWATFLLWLNMRCFIQIVIPSSSSSKSTHQAEGGTATVASTSSRQNLVGRSATLSSISESGVMKWSILYGVQCPAPKWSISSAETWTPSCRSTCIKWTTGEYVMILLNVFHVGPIWERLNSTQLNSTLFQPTWLTKSICPVTRTMHLPIHISTVHSAVLVLVCSKGLNVHHSRNELLKYHRLPLFCVSSVELKLLKVLLLNWPRTKNVSARSIVFNFTVVVINQIHWLARGRWWVSL